MPPWKLLETNYATVKQQSYEVAVLPLGATEPHNLHLPYGTDVLEGDLLGEEICSAAYERGAKVVLLPTIPYGTETNLREFPLAMNSEPVDAQCRRDGPRRIAGELRDPQDCPPQQPRWQRAEAALEGALRPDRGPAVPLQLVEDLRRRLRRDFRAARGPRRRGRDVALPGLSTRRLVARQEDGTLAADDATTAEMRFEALRRGWVSITRPWHLLTTNAGAANPHAATAEKGRQVMEVIVERMATFLVELSAAEIDERFPFSSWPGQTLPISVTYHGLVNESGQPRAPRLNSEQPG